MMKKSVKFVDENRSASGPFPFSKKAVVVSNLRINSSTNDLTSLPPYPPTNLSTPHAGPYNLHFRFIDRNSEVILPIPYNIVFQDLSCHIPSKVIDINGWTFSHRESKLRILSTIASECRDTIESLSLDFSVGLNPNEDLVIFRNKLKKLKKLSLAGLCPSFQTKSPPVAGIFGPDAAMIICSFRGLTSLNLSDNIFTDSKAIFVSISETLSQLKSLKLARCEGITDPCLRVLGQCIQRYRKLSHIDLSYSATDFGDDGVVSLVTAGFNILVELNFAHCGTRASAGVSSNNNSAGVAEKKALSSLCLAGLRNRMSSLTTLNISSIAAYGGSGTDPREGLGQSAYEWIAEGCRALIALDLSNSAQLNNVALIKIGTHCKLLQKLNLSKCVQIDDEGLVGFMASFTGALTHLDLNGNILCTSISIAAIALCPPDSRKQILPTATAGALQELRCNGLAKVTSKSLTALWSNAPKLQRFEMACELASSSTHRKSTMPHFSDQVLLHAEYSQLREVILTGCCLVTDRGLCALADKCGDQLRKLDVSGCHAVTELLLLKLASESCRCRLSSLVVNGCIKMANTGLVALCTSSKASAITELSFNGCSMLTDLGLSQISRLAKLQVLSIRGCDQVTEAAILKIADGCRLLREIEMSNCDLIGNTAISTLVHNCRDLTALSCEGCNIVDKEFASCVHNKLPLARAAIGKCRLEPHQRPVREYNKYIIGMRLRDKKCFIIQRFMRLAVAKTVVRFMRKMKIKNHKQLMRVFRALKRTLQDDFKARMSKFRGSAAVRLQVLMRRCFAVRLARKKARRLRLERRCATDIQRVFRGRKCRKEIFWKYRKYFRCMIAFRNIGRKIILLQSARRLHLKIRLAQEFGRTCAARLRYIRMRNGFILLQQRFKKYYAAKKVQDLADFEIEKVRAAQRRLDNAARKIQYNMKACLFNYEMSKYILVCCIHYRTEYDLHTWHATILQKRWRGFMVRLKNKRKKQLESLEYKSATKIQSLARRRYIIKQYIPYRDYMRSIFARWARLIAGRRRVRLNLGRITRKVQKAYRRYVYTCYLGRAATQIQRVFRGQYYRSLNHDTIFAKEIAAVNKIKYCYRRHLGRRKRYAMWARMHMAVYKIEGMVWKHFNYSRMQRQTILERQRQYMETLEAKKALALARRERAVEIIREAAFAARIVALQRRVRKWLERRRELREKQQKELEQQLLDAALHAEEDELKKGRVKNPIVKAVSTVSNVGKSVASSIMKLNNTLFGSTEAVDDRDRTLIKNAILKYQVQNILQEGITNLHLTVGEIEYKNFLAQQHTVKNANLPHMEAVAGDLSGSLELSVRLWAELGTGFNCITEISVKEKSSFTSNEGMKIIVSAAASQSVRVIWHPDLPFYLEGSCAMKRGKSEFAIEAVRIVNSQATKREVTRVNKLIAHGMGEEQGQASIFREAVDLERFGFYDCSVWVSSRTANSAEDEDDLYKFGKLTQMTWYDQRLKKVIRSFNLSESDVFAMRGAFDEMLQGRVKANLRVEEVFNFLDFPYGQISKWVFESIQPAEEGQITFSEYLHMICFYIMFAPKDMVKFIFSSMDSEGIQYLRRDQFTILVGYLAQNSPFSVRAWESQYERYYEKGLKFMFLNNFQSFMTDNPSALWQSQLLQRKMMAKNLGVSYWERKMEQFRVVREELGIRQR